MSGPQLSAAIDALAITLFEVRGLAYGLPRNWHALLDSEQGDYRLIAIDILRQMKPKIQPPDLSARVFDLGVAMARRMTANSVTDGGE